jgi:hypothetical protein
MMDERTAPWSDGNQSAAVFTARFREGRRSGQSVYR